VIGGKEFLDKRSPARQDIRRRGGEVLTQVPGMRRSSWGVRVLL
jgi:hypothetical protein